MSSSRSPSRLTSPVRVSAFGRSRGCGLGLCQLRSQIDFGMFFPIQKAAIACLNGPRDEVEAQRLKYQGRRDACAMILRTWAGSDPHAHGSIMWLKASRWSHRFHGVLRGAHRKAGVVVTPGASFGRFGRGRAHGAGPTARPDRFGCRGHSRGGPVLETYFDSSARNRFRAVILRNAPNNFGKRSILAANRGHNQSPMDVLGLRQSRCGSFLGQFVC